MANLVALDTESSLEGHQNHRTCCALLGRGSIGLKDVPYCLHPGQCTPAEGTVVMLQQFLTRQDRTARVARLLLILGCLTFLVGELLLQIHPRPYVFFPDFSNDYNAALAMRHGANPVA